MLVYKLVVSASVETRMVNMEPQTIVPRGANYQPLTYAEGILQMASTKQIKVWLHYNIDDMNKKNVSGLAKSYLLYP